MNLTFVRPIEFYLLCLIAFAINQEEILLYFFDLDTVLKPYRVLMLFFLLVVFVKRGPKCLSVSRVNFFVIALFLISILVAVVRSMFASVNFDYLISTLLLIVVNVAFYIALCNSIIDYRKYVVIMVFFLLGLYSNLFIYDSDYQGGRFSGFFSNPNSLGFVSLLGLVLLVFLSNRSRSAIGRFLLLFLTVPCFLFMNESGSRTVFYLGVAILFTIFLGFVVTKSKQSLIFISVTTAVVFLMVLADFIPANRIVDKIEINALEREKYKAEHDQDNERIILAKASFDAFVETNFCGLGLGQFQYIANFYPFVAPHNSSMALERLRKDEGLSAHGTIWTTMAEVGFIGLILFFAFVTGIFNRIVRQLRSGETLGWLNMQMFIILFMYSVAHVVFLSQVFWVFLGFVMLNVFQRKPLGLVAP